jgi:hypothetical protein
MKVNDLLVRPNPKLRARRKADTTKPQPTRPNEWGASTSPRPFATGFSSHPIATHPRQAQPAKTGIGFNALVREALRLADDREREGKVLFAFPAVRPHERPCAARRVFCDGVVPGIMKWWASLGDRPDGATTTSNQLTGPASQGGGITLHTSAHAGDGPSRPGT